MMADARRFQPTEALDVPPTAPVRRTFDREGPDRPLACQAAGSDPGSLPLGARITLTLDSKVRVAHSTDRVQQLFADGERCRVMAMSIPEAVPVQEARRPGGRPDKRPRAAAYSPYVTSVRGSISSWAGRTKL